MNQEIEVWRSQQYAANVRHLAQQKGSRLAPVVRKETFKGKAEFFDRLAAGTAQQKTSRNADTPNLDLTHTRRMLTTDMWEWATLVDKKDKLQNIHDPENEYAVAARNALGRAMDDAIIDGALDYASVGESGSSTTSLGNAQKVTAVASSALDYANIQLLRKAKRVFDESEIEGKRYLVCKADFLERLLATTEVSSADYNTVKALVQGELNTFLGFNFIHSERLPLATAHDVDTYKFNTTTGLYDSGGTALGGTEKSALCFVEGSIILGMQEGMVGKIDPRPDKSYAMQVYASMDFGAVRMEEAGVVQLIYKA